MEGLAEGYRCIHQLGYQCKKCGFVTIPARFYATQERKDASMIRQERSYKAALKEYCDVTGRSYDPVVVTENVTEEGMSQVVSQKVCGACSEGFEGYGKLCGKCRKAKSRAK